MPTDYFTPISNAVARLRPNTADARRSIYDQARQLLIDEAKNGHPGMAVSELIQEQRTLEQAIQMVEAHATFNKNAQARDQETRERSVTDRQVREQETRDRAASERADQLSDKEMRRIEAEQRHAQRRVQRRGGKRPGTGGTKTALIVAGALAAVFLLAGIAAYVLIFGLPNFRSAQQPPPAQQQTPAPPKQDEQAGKVQKLLERASQLIEAGDPNSAVPILNEAIVTAPDAQAYTLRGHAYLQLKDFDRAIEDFSEAIRLGGRDFYTFIGRGVAYRFKRDFQRSIADYDEAIRIRPTHAGAWNNRCFAHAITNNLDAALSDCNEALRLAPDEPHTLDSRALIYLKQKQYDRAIADYEAVLKAMPNTPSALYGRGYAKLKKGDKRGQADISTATTTAPGIAQEFERLGLK